MQFESRSTVGLPGLDGVPTNISPGDGGTAIHYNGPAVGITQADDHSECRAWMRGVHDYHVNTNGWAYFAYTGGVCQHGIVMEGRGTHRRTAANGTNYGNENYYAVVALLGGNEEPSDAMLAGLVDAVLWLRSDGGAGSDVVGHRDLTTTSCPGDRLYAWVHNGMPTNGQDGGDMSLIGLSKGDQGERVKALQVCIMYAGVDLPQYGADADYGDETAEALRQVRASVGSDAEEGWGDNVSAWAFAQLHRAMAQKEAQDAAAVSGSTSGTLPDTVTVSGELTVQS